MAVDRRRNVNPEFTAGPISALPKLVTVTVISGLEYGRKIVLPLSNSKY
jgi:hypothetical protein